MGCGLIVAVGVWRFALAASSTAPVTTASSGLQPSPLEFVPADAPVVLVSYGRALDPSTGQMVQSLLSTASLVGLFNADQQILADSVAAFVAVSKFPNAVFLLDSGARKLGEGSFTLDHLSLGMVVQASSADQEKLLVLLKQTIDHYFTADDAEMTWVGEGIARHQKLGSKKFPTWCCWEWGSVGDRFLFTVGPGAYAMVFATVTGKQKSLAADSFVRATGPHDANLNPRFISVYLNLDELSRQLRSTMGKTYDQAVRSFGAEGLNRFMYTSGYTGRAYVSKNFTLRGDEGEVRVLTGDFPPNDPRARSVPDQAEVYGVGYTELSRAIRYLTETYLASRNPNRREKLIRNYRRLAEETQCPEVHQFLTERFGKSAMVVVHDWPKHPFNLPFAKTLLIQHQPAPNFKIQAEKILATWRAMLRAMADPDKPNSTKPAKPASAWEKAFDLQLDRAPDGTWFLHAGPLVLIAIGLDDNFLVLSYSIPAAQMNLQHLKTAFRVPNTQSVSKGGT